MFERGQKVQVKPLQPGTYFSPKSGKENAFYFNSEMARMGREQVIREIETCKKYPFGYICTLKDCEWVFTDRMLIALSYETNEGARLLLDKEEFKHV